MSILGSNWKEEETPQEKYDKIIGGEFYGDENELRKQIEKDIDNNFTSKTERRDLMDLFNELENNNK